jgi:hypothetical protein
MKKIMGTCRSSSSSNNEPSQTRRKLLMGCAYLPAAPLLAMLGGCDKDGPEAAPSIFQELAETPPVVDAPETAGLKIPLPPYKTTDDILPPTPTPKVDQTANVPVTHVPKQTDTQALADPAPELPEAEIKPTHMNVGIYNLEYNSFKQVSARKIVPADTPGAVTFTKPSDVTKTIIYEDIGTYLKRSLDNRFALVYRAMVTAFAKHSPREFDVSFFTAPEFYWNIPFGDFLTEAELQAAGPICQETVTKHARDLIAKFPEKKYGKIILLPGSIATVQKNPDPRKVDGTAVTGTVYEASNHLVCTHNLSLDEVLADGTKRPAYMIWPKRVVSPIDYYDGDRCNDTPTILKKSPAHPDKDNPVISCRISKANGLTVNIAYVSSSVARSFDAAGRELSKTFQNDIVEGLPFGIDICLDYNEASVQSDRYRMAQLDERNFKLDFVIAAGIGLSTGNYANTPHIQYAIHNDGILTSSESSLTDQQTWIPKKKLYSTIWKLNYVERDGTITGDLLSPLGAKSPYDETRGVLPIVQTSAFVKPDGADSSGIPNILDMMNPAQVRVWRLDVDVSDTATPAVAAKLVAGRQSAKPEKAAVRFIE